MTRRAYVAREALRRHQRRQDAAPLTGAARREQRRQATALRKEAA